MVRQLIRSDLLVEQNRDGNFFYIRPAVDLFPAGSLVTDRTITNPTDGKGLYLWDNDSVNVENVTVSGSYAGISINGSTNARLYDYTFFDAKPNPMFGSAIHRTNVHLGHFEILRSYGNGLDRPNNIVDPAIRDNTDFFDNNYMGPELSRAVFIRDITAKNFSNSVLDNKSVIYIMNATLSDADMVIRAHEGATFIIVNSVINTGAGQYLGQITRWNSRIYHFNTLWNGKLDPDLSLFAAHDVAWADYPRALAQSVIKLTSNPLPGISDFFAVDDQQYRAQVSVNGTAWVDIALPSNGYFGRHIGDTMMKLPDLGNGTYRIRAWAVDRNGEASASVITDSYTVTNSSFDFVGGAPTDDPFLPDYGTSSGERMTGTSSEDLIYGRGGNDQVMGGAGRDTLFGEDGADLMAGGPGADLMDGGGGDDRMQGDDGADTMIGGQGADTLTGGLGDDVLRPGGGLDFADGGDGGDLLDLSDAPARAGGYTVNLGQGLFQGTGDAASIERFVNIENVVGTSSADRITGDGGINRITGGLGDDVMTGAGFRDIYIFDNAVDFGTDRITDFGYNQELWFTRFTSLGSDNLARITWDGKVGFAFGDAGGQRQLTIGYGDRWLSYAGRNAEGFHVYRLHDGEWPSVDVLPDGSGGVSDGGALNFSDRPFNAGGYVIDLPLQRITPAGGTASSFITPVRARVFGTSSNDTIIGDRHANRIEGGRGDDAMTGGGDRDVFVFDNGAAFGSDRILDFAFSEQLWFTQFTDLGADNLAPVLDGRLRFSAGAGVGVVDIGGGFSTRWIEYMGRNAEGYHVYQLDTDPWPSRDILPVVNTPPSLRVSGQWLDFSASPQLASGYVIDLPAGSARSATGAAISFATPVRARVTATSSNDVIIGDQHINRIESGRGDDVMTGGGDRDIFVIDNSVDFGSDRITDFTFNEQLWFTQFTDLGADNLAPILEGGLRFLHSGGKGVGVVDIGGGFATRWIEYMGRNAEGFHVYQIDTDPWPSVDVLPVNGGTPVVSVRGDTLDFSGSTNDAGGYSIELGRGLITSVNGRTASFVTPANARVIATGSNDRIIADAGNNRILGGPGDDTMTGGGSRDVYVFDNDSDFGNDRITDFNFFRELWFTQFTDLGPDRLAPVGDGNLRFDYAGGAGKGVVNIGGGFSTRWIEYMGRNAEGFHVYALDTDPWPSVDLLPA